MEKRYGFLSGRALVEIDEPGSKNDKTQEQSQDKIRRISRKRYIDSKPANSKERSQEQADNPNQSNAVQNTSSNKKFEFLTLNSKQQRTPLKFGEFGLKKLRNVAERSKRVLINFLPI